MLGITKAKKRLKKELGITALLKPVRWWPNQKRRFKRRIGYYSEESELVRDRLPTPGECWVVVAALAGGMTLVLVLVAGP